MRKIFVFLFISLAAGVWADTEINVQRAASPINSGFKERIFVDGREVTKLGNGESQRIRVSNGNHVIHAQLYTLETQRLSFNTNSGSIGFIVTPYSLTNFVIERDSNFRGGGGGGSTGGVEGSLERAAAKIMDKIPSKARVAIVYVVAEDRGVADFIAGELEVILVDNGRIIIDRSQLDRIRQEQRLQMSGEVDDRQAVSIGKLAGASVIITGVVNGDGDLRRLRLRALDTQTAQVLASTSERY